MVSLDWKTLNSDVSIKETKKKFYNQYYYSLKYLCHGSQVLRDGGNIEDKLEYRRQRRRTFNYGGSWVNRFDNDNLINVEQLHGFDHVRQQFGQQVRFRIEEPYVTLYSDNEQVLYNIADQHLKEWVNKLWSVHRPASDATKAIVDRGAIIVKTDVNYRYKFFCKDGNYHNKSAVYSYLHNLGDQVKLSKMVWSNLSKPHSYTWGIWFYANDPSIATMLNIIEPNVVTNIHELVVA